ncbi:methyl-accepting chemotaxis protein [Magnetofaba australis]|uniref:Chemoreceptor zinc-binding domain-containing protein n=1 Tax=Magnetofaba australis IT-1 TaxID=1434232 RepID=A0A1Y2K4A8_9PROT|nr:CZB domain-containing protein [Magnetofaba australis]OSM02476.1 hypothetical protein MAIT1_02621 [Magnetofaba australis IT-1]
MDHATHAAQSTNEVGESIKALRSVNNAILQVIAEQSEGVDEISQAIKTVDQANQEVTRNTEQMAAGAQEVARAASEAAVGTQEIASSASTVSAGAQDVAQESSQVKEKLQQVREFASEVSLASAKVQKSMIDLMVSSYKLDGIVGGASMLLEATAAASDSLKRAEEGFSVGQPLFDIGAVKQSHLAWMEQLINIVRGNDAVPEEVIEDERSCAFGKWYLEVAGEWAADSLFQEIGVAHKQVHDQGKEIVQMALAADKHADVEFSMVKFNAMRVKLFTLLDEFYLRNMTY